MIAEKLNTVLLIEDNPGDAALALRMLSENFRAADTTWVTRLSEARSKVADHGSPELVLLDLGLPDAQGFEALTAMVELCPDVPVVVLTSVDDSLRGIEAVRRGAQDYLVKDNVTTLSLTSALCHGVERQHNQGALRELSVRDPLTGLYNRRGLLGFLEHEVQRSNRNQQPFTVLFIDIDNMKTINDTLGHQKGDQALVVIATVMTKTFRECDAVARIGGDEFAVLLGPGGEDSEAALLRLRQHLDERNASAECHYKISVSIGESQYEPGSERTAEELLDGADRDMYGKKQLHHGSCDPGDQGSENANT